ncbi:DUF4012 domain-containing protein [Mycolicibacterium chlorophenolicum]|uniref:DUF4012 domain-containing protein n=1 Tax=Mycolicibacterium chlorophenolicum TaxID=37916 RepID=UPI0026D32633
MGLFSRRQHDHRLNAEEEADDEERGRAPGLLRSRGFIVASTVVVLLILGLGCWVAVGALQAKSNLEQARGSAQEAKDSLLAADTKAAAASARDATDSAQAARDATHSLAWNIVAAVPWLGSPFKTGQQITDVVSGLATNVLQPAADVGVTISPDRLYKDGRVDVDLLRSQEAQLSTLAEKATRLNAEAGAIQDPHYLSTIGDARTQLQGQIADLTSILENTALAARLVPPMMGADGPRTYFMGFQTNAEARGTGGLLGGFGVLRFDNGKPTVDTLGSNIDLADALAPIDLGLEYDQQYGFANPFTDFRNSNMSPHFPYAAQIWRTMWEQQTGTKVDGVIAIDPVALSYLLGAVGPITMPDGEVVSKDNVVELTESTAYKRFPTDQLARKQYLQGIANAVVNKITGQVKSPRQLLDALGKSVSERRIAVWSSVPEEQRLLETTALSHSIPDDDAPYAAVVFNNLGGNKLDYYLKSQIEYAADDCKGDTRASTVTVKLTNEVPSEPLPDYVAGDAGLSPDVPIEVPKGTNIISVRLFATKGANLSAAILNGQRVPAIVSTERGHPVFEVQVIIPPGQTGDISYQLSEPTAAGAPRVPVQPLVEPTNPRVSVPECSHN